MTKIADVYISAACTEETGAGGYAAIIYHEGEPEFGVTGNARNTTLAQMTYSAATSALTSTINSSAIRLHTTCRSLVRKFEDQGYKNRAETDWDAIAKAYKSQMGNTEYKPYWHHLWLAGRYKNVTYVLSQDKERSQPERQCEDLAQQSSKDAQEYRVFHFRAWTPNPKTAS